MTTGQRRVHKCATMTVHNRLVQENPENYVKNRREIERLTSAHVRQTSRAGLRTGIDTICCVVHVVYSSPQQNIPDEQIFSQFKMLNLCYRNLDPNVTNVPPAFAPSRADAQIEFQVARRDVDGKSTSGIIRTATNKTGFTHDDGVKSSSSGGIDAWPSDKYFNIWVCNLEEGLLGYAQFPGGPRSTDGVVINYQAFGTIGTAAPPYNLGKTAVHEIGHCMNLLHIWGDDNGGCEGSDNVDDTPNQASENYGKPVFPHISCGNAPNGDMFMNYMDYTDDAAMYMFTAGQVKRIDATLNGPRASILLSDGLTPPGTQDLADQLTRVDHKANLAFDGVNWVQRSSLDYTPEGF
jgi:Pregnancy-associated plasma protein-A